MTEAMRERAEVMARQLHGTGQGEVMVALLAELDRLNVERPTSNTEEKGGA